MGTLFLFCAAVGGTIMLAQLGLSLLGLGGSHGLHLGGDTFDGSPDLPGDTAGHGAGADHADSHSSDSNATHSSTWYFGLITFQTVVAAVTFFGLTGLASLEADLSQPLPLMVAVAGGAGAMFGVHALMRSLSQLRADGTERIEGAVGSEATVYLSIPAHSNGPGKVQLTLQGRLVEYAAVTSGEAIPTGVKVVVVGVLGGDTVDVEPIGEPQPSAS